LQPLAAADAVSLFAARAAARRAVDDEQVAAVCRAVDNLPLAIELAAARTRSLSVGEIAKRLDDRFALLTDPTGRRPSRRGALREAIAWSYDLLFPDDQRGLWALSCFAGGAPLDAAERVIAALDVPAPASLDVFDRLVDRSLTTTELDAIGAVRYGLLDSIRSYAEERLDEAGARAGAQGAHARWVADLAARADGEARGAGQPWCVRTARQERANVDLALDWTAVQQPELGLDIAIGFGWTWVVIGEGAAGAARIRRALVAVAEPDAVRAATANLCAAWLEASAGDLMAAFDDLERAAVLIEILGDQRLEADLDRHRAFVSMQAGRPHDALAAARRSRGAADRLHDEWMAAGAANLVAFASMTLGDQGAARQAAGDALRRREALGDTWGQMHAVAMLGRIAIAEGHLAEAEASLRRAAETSAELGFVGQTALHLSNLGEVQQAAGDHDLALVTLAQALDEAVAGSDRRLAATIRLRRAQSLHALGWDDEAAGELRTNLDWYARAGGGDGERASAALLAELQAGPADVDRL
jgi:tetratricopeptide (TPR) repeat protein